MIKNTIVNTEISKSHKITFLFITCMIFRMKFQKIRKTGGSGKPYWDNKISFF